MIPITITSYNNQSVSWPQQAAFCAELGEDIYLNGSYTYDKVSLGELGASSANTYKGAGIGSGGIGSEKGKLVQILFDYHYTSSTPSDWSNLNAAAMQLALWKVTHEPWDQLQTSNGRQLDISAIYNNNHPHFGYYDGVTPSEGDVYTVAQNWIDDAFTVYDNNHDYTGVLQLLPLASDGSGDRQDLITVLVPEPSSWALAGGLVSLLFALDRRRSRKRRARR